jgi:Cu-Zn family superoxide dismutase
MYKMGGSISRPTEAIVVFRSTVRGVVTFREIDHEILIRVNLTGLPPGLHGFHIHECGDLSEGCQSACAHYNPTGAKHGGLKDAESHAGDLGNILADDQGNCKMDMTTNKFHLQEILGRSLIIHGQADDLGVHNTVESKTTGTSGARIACEIIGIAKPSTIAT